MRLGLHLSIGALGSRGGVADGADLPSWLLRPGGNMPALDLDFYNNRAYCKGLGVKAPESLLSVTRASSGTLVDANGNLLTFGANELRRAAGVGAAFNEQRTNILKYSGDQSNAVYTKTGNASAVLVGTAPDGVGQWLRFTESASNVDHALYGSGSGTNLTSGTTYAVSVFLRTGTRRYVSLRGEQYAFVSVPNYPWITFDTQAGTITAIGAGVLSSGVITIAPGIWRVWLTFTSNVTLANSNVVLSGSGDSTAPPVTDSTGNAYAGNGSYFDTWGWQVEAGAFPTAYIPTTSAAATRALDNVSLTSAAQTAAGLSLTQGTWYVEWVDTAGPVGASAYLLEMRVDGNNRLRIFKSSGNKVVCDCITSNVNQGAQTSTGSVAADTPYKLAFAYKDNDVTAAMTAALQAAVFPTDTSYVMPVGSFSTSLGSDIGFTAGDNVIRRLTWWPQRLSDTLLDGLRA